ncbi:methyltransferase domain-containing protein [Yinghuangia soli]|uniref:Protein-L-isoaspartate O-methyltransferase n=1 Tax=Yinghuangia soli TaxID=2908204 RepID=A0AA41PW86_9ACTN|nr:methyltransferase domain-containing protein [Yinghuangia soli]MCF2525612.1 methyltransferase [Yinghuangia soli]
MTGVSRRDFIPDVIWPFDSATETYGAAVDRQATPGRWSEFVSADIPLVTQWDDGAHTGPEPGRLATSSASMSGAVADMLTALQPAVGGAYLDIGTGTGYTPARIAEIAGPSGFVTTVEVDAELATVARGNLERAGVRNVEVITGDGFDGWARSAPYSGVHVTCGIRRISHAWVAQCLPGARIVLPWGTDYTQHDRLLTLTVGDDGTASGPFGGGLSFMKMRAQRLTYPEHAAYAPKGWDDDGREGHSDLTWQEAAQVIGQDGGFAVGLRVRDCFVNPARTEEGAVSIWLYSTSDRSVAYAGFSDDHAPDIMQAGPRSLWDEVADARAWWAAHGRPEPERFGLTVGAEEQRAWLDSPDGESWPLRLR